jgi:hypothetical protein
MKPNQTLLIFIKMSQVLQQCVSAAMNGHQGWWDMNAFAKYMSVRLQFWAYSY